MALLEVRALSVRYGAVRAVEEVSLSIEEGEIVALIGANGAGKSSTIRAVVGLAPASGGAIESPSGRSIAGRSTSWIATHCAFAYVPEDRGVLTRMSVRENLELGAYIHRRRGPAWVSSALERAFDAFPILKARQPQLAGTLSGGEAQMLAIARALIGEPKLLLLDEPSLGLAPRIVSQVFDHFDAIRKQGTSILLVEQNSRKALQVSDRAYVLERGRVVVEGPSPVLAQDDRIRRAYLGLGAA